jgi:hypothetical protein
VQLQKGYGFDSRRFDGLTGQELLQQLVALGEPHGLNNGTCYSREMFLSTKVPEFDFAEDYITLIRLCARYMNHRVYVTSSGTFFRLKSDSAMTSGTGLEEQLKTMIFQCEGGFHLMQAGLLEFEELLQRLHYRGQFVQKLRGFGISAANTITQLFQNNLDAIPSCSEARETISFIQSVYDDLPGPFIKLLPDAARSLLQPDTPKVYVNTVRSTNTRDGQERDQIIHNSSERTVVNGGVKKSYKYTLSGFERNECIFIHIPKCAGVSINNALFGNEGGGHKTARQYLNIFGSKFYSYFKFSFVRNPYTRLVSAYEYLKHGGHPAWPDNQRFGQEVIESYNGFSDFVLQWLQPDKHKWPQPHFYPQVHFLMLNGDIGLDFLGHFETIEEDFSIVCEKLGRNSHLPQKNTTQGDRKSIYSYYKESAVAKRVREVYRVDFDTLGYSTDLDKVHKAPNINREQS